MKWFAVAAIAALGAFGVPPGHAQVPVARNERAFVYSDGVYTTLYGPGPPGIYSTTAIGVNNSGQIIGSYSDRYGNTYGFIYSDGTYTALDVPGSVYTQPLGINSSGQVVGLYYRNGSNSPYGFLYTDGTYITLNPPGSDASVAFSINASGDVVGDYGVENSQAVFLYSSGSYTTLAILGATVAAQQINNSGQIVGEYAASSSSQLNGYLYANGGYIALAPPNSAFSLALGINESGQVVGYYGVNGVPPPDFSSIEYGFLYDNGAYTTLDFPGSDESFALAINDSGQIVGDWELGLSEYGFLYNDGIYTILDVPNQSNYPTTFTELTDINDSGEIVGIYGTSFAPVPEPSTWAMMLFGFAGLGFAGYRRRQKTLGRSERLRTIRAKRAPSYPTAVLALRVKRLVPAGQWR